MSANVSRPNLVRSAPVVVDGNGTNGARQDRGDRTNGLAIPHNDRSDQCRRAEGTSWLTRVLSWVIWKKEELGWACYRCLPE